MLFPTGKNMCRENMIFTKGVAVERGSAVVKNTYLQNILVLDVVIELFCCPKRAILDNPECAFLVPRPDVPGSRGCHLTGFLTLGQWVSSSISCGNAAQIFGRVTVYCQFCQYLTQERLFHSVNTDYPILVRNFRLSCNFCEFKYSHCGLMPELRTGENVSSPLCGLLFPPGNSLFAEIAA